MITFLALAHMLDATQLVGDDNRHSLHLQTCWMLRNWSGMITFLALAHMLDATQLVGDDNIPCACTHVGCYATGLQHRHVVHQLKQFTGEVETARGASKIAGTQCVDRLWQSLKRFLPPKLAAKDPKTKSLAELLVI